MSIEIQSSFLSHTPLCLTLKTGQQKFREIWPKPQAVTVSLQSDAKSDYVSTHMLLLQNNSVCLLHHLLVTIRNRAKQKEWEDHTGESLPAAMLETALSYCGHCLACRALSEPRTRFPLLQPRSPLSCLQAVLTALEVKYFFDIRSNTSESWNTGVSATPRNW